MKKDRTTENIELFPIPVTIVVGFPGAGKTTLINRILTADHRRNIAVIVDKSGLIDNNAEWGQTVGEHRVSPANNGIYRVPRGDVICTALNLATLTEPPDHILIEMNGVSFPTLLARSFLDAKIRGKVRLNGIVTVVDTEQVVRLSGREAELARAQVEDGDLIVLNKIDRVNVKQFAEVRLRIKNINPKKLVFAATRCKLPVEVLLGKTAIAPPIASKTASRPGSKINYRANFQKPRPAGMTTVLFQRPGGTLTSYLHEAKANG